jgi:hypothetical protein
MSDERWWFLKDMKQSQRRRPREHDVEGLEVGRPSACV